MLEVIDDVLAAEERADRILAEARSTAERTRAEFAELETRTLREATAAADARQRDELAAFRLATDRRVAEAEAKLASDLDASVRGDGTGDDAARIEAAVRHAVRLISEVS